MYDITQAQAASEKKLNKQGFRFSNWIPAQPDGNCQPMESTENQGIIIMIRKPTRHSTEYREIEPDGSIN